MFDGDEFFAYDGHVGVCGWKGGEEVEGGQDGAVGGVFEGDDAVFGFGGLNGGEDAADAGAGVEGVGGGGEVLEGCLGGVSWVVAGG